MALWVKVLQQWERLPVSTLPTAEVTPLIQALTSMQQTSVLQHPRVTVSSSRTPPKLKCPPKKRKKKLDQAEGLRAEHARVTHEYKQQGWTIVYPDGSSENHLVVVRVGGYGINFGDTRNTTAYIPLSEEQTNIRALRALEGHRLGEYLLVCPHCLLIVNGMLGWVQKWHRHG